MEGRGLDRVVQERGERTEQMGKPLFLPGPSYDLLLEEKLEASFRTSVCCLVFM